MHLCRIILVQPTIPGNIGATARVMRNMGLSDLVLVNPEASPADPKARQMATHGEDILERARSVATLEEAVADCTLVLGTSARHGGLVRRQSVVSPAEIMPRLADELRAGRAALVFGTETNGLTDADVTRCHYLVRIPAEPDFPALNLAQAVAICLYELRKAWENSGGLANAIEPAANFAAQDHMFAQLQQGLEAIHFLYGSKAESLMHAIRHLLGRARLTPMEVDVLLGLARQIQWYVNECGKDAIPPAEEQP